MNSKEPLGRLSDLFSRFNLMPTRPQSAQATEGFYGNLLAKLSDTLSARDGRRALDLGRPPCDNHGIALEEFLYRAAHHFRNQQRNYSRAVPELHRPSRRSSRRASSTPDGFRAFGSFLRIKARGGAAVAKRSPPRRSNLASRPSGSSGASVRAEMRRATGRPRSVITIVSPCCTRSINALSWFFASVIVAFFTWLE